MKCATHSDVETNLKCGKCERPVCPKCFVQTPVGARCRDCAGMAKLPTFNISTPYFLRAIAVGLGMAVVCGIIWSIIEKYVPLFSFNLLLAPAAGYAIGEVVGLAVNRKRGLRLAVVGGVSVAASYFVTYIFLGGPTQGLFNIIYHLVALVLGIFVAVTRLR